MGATDIYEQLGVERQKSIYRIDQPEKGNHGWNVVVYWRRNIHTKFFSDRVYSSDERGDPERSFAAAINFRDKLQRELGKPHSSRVIIGTSTGITRRLKNGIDVIEISWCPAPNTVSRTSISIKKYGGVRKAIQHALEIRRQKWLESLITDEDTKTAKKKAKRLTRRGKTRGPAQRSTERRAARKTRR